MKYKFLLLTFFLPLHIFACKCANEPTIKNSFENASLVFIGEVYDILEVPNGFKTSQNTLSKIKIDKVYKADHSDDFYNETATLFHSPLMSCHILFAEKGKYLVFAYIDKGTGLLYSEHCLLQKRWEDLTQQELKELQKLSNDYQLQLKAQDTPVKIVEILDDDPETAKNIIKKLDKEISNINKENKRIMIITTSSIIIIFILLIVVLVLRKKIRVLKKQSD
ncbi:hypothetical protein [Chryseobacterium jejuense]|uniref:Tissue inhibitor of metalloproteinase n=1 Tax=Chryseobacterium jejuense TaxID=445960 RepID=A0A2X2X0A6_CHRJE|nr:hypothetical protein [Chryseobacterium jejuense]SDJ56799.1 Tissue inhibitor of metalloproteinase [Chryseobacterium jejuense]SQB46174.1 Uncharacterised protein [Chryseobacterium jejuense]